MGAIFIANYPRPADNKYKFDMGYYLKVHMPLQLKHHAQFGMRSYHVIEPELKTPYGTSPYVVQTIEFWDSVEGFFRALKEGSNEPAEDIPNYTDIKAPFPIIGNIKGHYIDSTFELKA